MAPEPDLERDALAPKQSAFDGPPPSNLVKFRNMVGIATPVSIIGDSRSRPGKNIATLTALGAASASHIAITILGSINTVIAGVQTYLKGQGLPNRLRQYEFGLRKLREHIEDRERDFSAVDCKLNADREIADIVAMYQVVRQTAEDNTPDTYLPMQGAGKKLLGQSDSSTTGADSTGFGTGMPTNGQAKQVAEAAPSKPSPTSDTPNQADGAQSPSDLGGVGKSHPESESSAGAGAGKDEVVVTGTSPNEVGEAEEAPLLNPGDKAGSSND